MIDQLLSTSALVRLLYDEHGILVSESAIRDYERDRAIPPARRMGIQRVWSRDDLAVAAGIIARRASIAARRVADRSSP